METKVTPTAEERKLAEEILDGEKSKCTNGVCADNAHRACFASDIAQALATQREKLTREVETTILKYLDVACEQWGVAQRDEIMMSIAGQAVAAQEPKKETP